MRAWYRYDCGRDIAWQHIRLGLSEPVGTFAALYIKQTRHLSYTLFAVNGQFRWRFNLSNKLSQTFLVISDSYSHAYLHFDVMLALLVINICPNAAMQIHQ